MALILSLAGLQIQQYKTNNTNTNIYPEKDEGKFTELSVAGHMHHNEAGRPSHIFFYTVFN